MSFILSTISDLSLGAELFDVLAPAVMALAMF
jgi:hypothetical protein